MYIYIYISKEKYAVEKTHEFVRTEHQKEAAKDYLNRDEKNRTTLRNERETISQPLFLLIL